MFFAAARMMNLDLKDDGEQEDQGDLALVCDDENHHNSLLSKMNTLRKGTVHKYTYTYILILCICCSQRQGFVINNIIIACLRPIQVLSCDCNKKCDSIHRLIYWSRTQISWICSRQTQTNCADYFMCCKIVNIDCNVARLLDQAADPG